MNEQYITISAEILESTHLRVQQAANKLDVNWDSTVDMILAHASAKLLNEIDEITSIEWLKKAIAHDSIKSNNPEGTKDSNLSVNLADLSHKIDEVQKAISRGIQIPVKENTYNLVDFRVRLNHRLDEMDKLLNRLVSAIEAIAVVNSELAAKEVK